MKPTALQNALIHPFDNPVIRLPQSPSPETTPSYVMLAEVLEVSGLAEELLHLLLDRQLFVFLEVSARQLLLDSA